MKKWLLSIALGVALANEPRVQALEQSCPNPFINSTHAALCVAGVCAVGAGLYKAGSYAYRQWNTWLEQKIINQAVEDLYLALTFNSTIDTLPEPERTKKFCRKAQLVKLRNNVLKKIVEKIQSGKLSPAHAKALEENFALALMGFGSIDDFRSETTSIKKINFVKEMLKKTPFRGIVVQNPCENQANRNYIFDYFVEDKIVDSILLHSKPINECTPQELLKKAANNKRRNEIIERVKQKMANKWVGTAIIAAGLTGLTFIDNFLLTLTP